MLDDLPGIIKYSLFFIGIGCVPSPPLCVCSGPWCVGLVEVGGGLARRVDYHWTSLSTKKIPSNPRVKKKKENEKGREMERSEQLFHFFFSNVSSLFYLCILLRTDKRGCVGG